MLIARQGVQTRIPVRLIDSTGAPVIGVPVTAILNSRVYVVKSDGSIVNFVLVDNTSWIEINDTTVPGLYHVVVPGTDLDTVGPTQLSIQPSASAFVGIVGAFLVEEYAALATTTNTKIDNLQATTDGLSSTLTLLRKIHRNRWKVAGNQLTVYDDDQTTPFLVWNLWNSAGQPTMTQIFERTLPGD